MKEIKAIVRKERVQQVLRALDEHGAGRVLVCHVHSLGAGVDPEDYRVSMEEGTTYTEKSKVELVCPDEAVDGILSALMTAARTGHPGDGFVVVSPVERVVKIRTGDEDILALV